MKIKVNGEERLIESNKSMSLNETMRLIGYTSNTVVVEVNKLIINSAEWDDKYIKNGDKLEIVSIVGGGQFFTKQITDDSNSEFSPKI